MRGGAVDWDELIESRGPTGRSHRLRTRTRWTTQESALPYRKSSRSLAALFVRFGAPLLLLVVFFTAIYVSFNLTLQRTAVLNAVSAAANMRASCARQAMVEMRKLEYLTTDGAYIRNSYW